MGNDGGSIPTRRELVKNAARSLNTSEVKASLLESQTHHWTWCPLSNRPLIPPIVSDSRGTLYNKDAIIESLLPSDTAAAAAATSTTAAACPVTSLRDVVEIRFATVTEGKEKTEKKICPVTSKELGPGTRAVYLVPCGHAFSDAAIREVQGEACVECNAAYQRDDVIPILPVSADDVARLSLRAEKLREQGLTHSLKKAPGGKKRKKAAAGEEAGETKEKTTEKTKEKEKDKKKEGIKNAATASLTARVLEEQDGRNKRRKIALNDNLKSLFSDTGYEGQKHKGGDFMTRGFSVPKRA